MEIKKLTPDSIQLLDHPPMPFDPTAFNATLVVVRHAEKKGSWREAPLTPQGKERAQRLKSILQNAPLKQVWSTDFFRTRQTVQPAAEYHHLSIQSYRGMNQQSLLWRMQEELQGGLALICGHQDSVPMLLNTALGQYKYPTFSSDEYSRLFIIALRRELPTRVLEFSY